MPAKSGIVLSPSEILTEHGIIERYLTDLPKGTRVWMYYNNSGKLISIEKKEIIVPIKKRNGDGDG